MRTFAQCLKFAAKLAMRSRLGRLLDDRTFIKLDMRLNGRKHFDIDRPETFSEKLQWLKLHNRRDEYTMMVDKLKVRDYISSTIGEEYLVPLIGAWDNPDDIDFASLPDKFVLKCNHNSGTGMCICKDKSSLDTEKVRRGLRKGLRQNYYDYCREWPYKNVERKIICEQFINDRGDDADDVGLTDYKFFCFNGIADSVMLCLGRHTGNTLFYFFDKEWKLRRYNVRGKAAPEGFTLPKPQQMDKMFEIAEALSKGLPFARIDMYNSGGKIYFSEITFFPDGGCDPNILPETDVYFGKLLDLSGVKQ